MSQGALSVQINLALKEVSKMKVETCSPKELATYLLQHRFNNDETKTHEFLMESALVFSKTNTPNASIKNENKTTSTFDDNIDSYITKHLGNKREDIPVMELSCIVPRGKHQTIFHTNGICFYKPHATKPENEVRLMITPENVQLLIFFPKPEDVRQKKKTATQMMLFVLREPVPILMGQDGFGSNNVNGKQKFQSQVCVQLDANQDLLLQKEWKVWKTQNKVSISTCEWNSSAAVFKSDTLNLPFVQCYHGVHTGSLFPLKDGLLFYKPILFVPRDKIHSIGCGRGGSSSTRYVDMNIICDDDDGGGDGDDDDDENNNEDKAKQQYTIEFTNINREELNPLNEYIQGLANLDSSDESDASDDDENDHGKDEDTKEDDESKDTDENEDPPKKRRNIPKRAAAKQGREATRYQMVNRNDDDEDDDDDDEEDYQFVDKPDEEEEEEEEDDDSEEEGHNHDDDGDEMEEDDETDSDGTETDNEENDEPRKKRKT